MQGAGPHFLGCVAPTVASTQVAPGHQGLRQSQSPSLGPDFGPWIIFLLHVQHLNSQFPREGAEVELTHVLTEGPVGCTAPCGQADSVGKGRAIASPAHMVEHTSFTRAVEKCKDQQEMSGFARLGQ